MVFNSMKKHSLVAGALVALLAPVSAIAGSAKGDFVDPVVVQTTPTTSPGNFYIGGALGYAVNGDDRLGIFNSGNQSLTFGTLENEGFTGSIFAGWEVNRARYGWAVEAHLMMGGVESDVTASGYTAEMEMNHAVTLRFKGDVPVAERTSLYGFGGLAYGDFDYRVSGTGAVGAASINEGVSEVGYTLGVGLEHAFDSNWSARIEYGYMSFGRATVRDANGLNTEATPDFNHVQVGVSYRF